MKKNSLPQPGRSKDPTQLNILPALSQLPRQIGIFPAFRAALVEDASANIALSTAGWRGRDIYDGGDFGIMLLEMCAYLCDVISFYDQYIAGESYLRTSIRDRNTQRIIDLIGYIPRPAVASIVDLALTLSGRIPITLPKYTVFRSGAFDDEKPQIFTLMNVATVHPLRSKFTLMSQPAKTFASAGGSVTTSILACDPGGVKVRIGDRVIVRSPAFTYAREVMDIADDEDAGGSTLKQVTLNKSVTIPGSTLIKDIVIDGHSSTDSLWAYSDLGRYAFYFGYLPNGSYVRNKVRLESVNRNIKVGQYIMLSREDDHRWFQVLEVNRIQGTIKEGETITVKDGSGNVISKTDTPNTVADLTELTVDADINSSSRKPTGADDFSNDISEEITVYYGFKSGAKVAGLTRDGIAADDELLVREKVEKVDNDYEPEQFILRDINENAVAIGGTLDLDGTLNVNESSKWDGDLVPPVTVYAATVQAVHGEQVTGELLGLGNGNIAYQSFALKKKPLTYINAPDAEDGSGYQNTLEIFVDGIRWHEVPRFYGIDSDERVYIVRVAEDGEASVTFGDGIHGARLPSGVSVHANYFFGAGAAAPPAQSVSQIVKPVKGLVAVTNPIAAYGGADAESPEKIKQYAPRSALMLGRAVSLLDYEAVAAGTTGVRVANAEWQWSGKQQRAVVHIWYIAEGNLDSLILDRLRGVSASGVPFAISQATARPRHLIVSILTHPDYIADTVSEAVHEVLLGESGYLLPEKLGINKPLIRSQILEWVGRVEGVLVPAGLMINGKTFSKAGIKGQVGKYFDLTVTVSAQVAPSTIPLES